MKKFINCSNHPSALWSAEQRKAAEKYGEIVDVPFPQVSYDLSEEQLQKLVDMTVDRVLGYHPEVVMCMGEFVVCYRLVRILKERGIKVLATRSDRQSSEELEENGVVRKSSIFLFRGFWEY